MSKTEVLPVSEIITVRSHETIYKTQKWWCAVVLGEQFGRRKIFLYLWNWDEKAGRWKRKQKFTIGSRNNWNDVKTAVEKFLEMARL